jgi:hypothetical protein
MRHLFLLLLCEPTALSIAARHQIFIAFAGFAKPSPVSVNAGRARAMRKTTEAIPRGGCQARRKVQIEIGKLIAYQSFSLTSFYLKSKDKILLHM